MADRRLPRAEDGLAPDRPLTYREWGARDAPPLAFWPGLNASAPWQLDELGPVWADRLGRRVLALSPPGWETDPLERDAYRPTALAAIVEAFFDEHGLERPVFVGFSWGATIGCHLAARAGERLGALVLLDAGYTDFQDMPDAQRPATFGDGVESLRASGRFESMDAYVAAVKARTRAWRPALEQRARAAVEERGGEVVVRVAPEVVAAGMDGVVDEPPSTTLATLGALELRILLVTAGDTIDEPWGQAALERFRSAVPSADVRSVRAGHDVLADAPEETTEILADWL